MNTLNKKAEVSALMYKMIIMKNTMVLKIHCSVYHSCDIGELYSSLCMAIITIIHCESSAEN